MCGSVHSVTEHKTMQSPSSCCHGNQESSFMFHSVAHGNCHEIE